MTSAQSGAEGGDPVERFHAASGRLVGVLTLAAVAVILVYVVVGARSLDGLRVATGALVLGVLVWLALLRPRATAYRDVLRLQNSLRDVDVPLVLVEDVHVGRMLTVWAGEERFVCVGVGAPLRELVRSSKGGAGSIGWDRLEEYSHQPTPPRSVPRTTYAQFVESQILALAEDARRRSRHSGGAREQQQPRHAWAWPGIVALTVAGLAFLASLLL